MEIDKKRWGILYCPKHSGRNPRKHRERLMRMLNERKVDYDIVQSESEESVERLILMLIHNGYKTIVIVGGDTAVNDAVNCLMQIEPRQRAEISLGVIPNGTFNDFCKFWGLKDSNMSDAIDTIVRHRIRKVDVGCIHYTNKQGEDKRRHFVNCVNIGLIADIMNLKRQTRRLLGSQTLSFLVSALLVIFHRLEYKMHLKINSDEVRRKIMNVCVGSGPGYGQTPNAVPYNGLLDVSVVYHSELLQLIEGMWLLFTGRFLNHRSVHPYRTRRVDVVSASHALVGVDGRLIETPVGAFSITVELEVINFLIP